MLIESFSGIRGVYGDSLTEQIASRYAAAFQQLLSEWSGKPHPRIVIGMDTRGSSPALQLAMMDMLFDVIDVGMASTPVVEHAVRMHEADGGIMITASHNEPEYNGFKFLRSDGAVLDPDKAEAVIGLYNSDRSFAPVDGSVTAIAQDRSLRSYASFLRETLGSDRIERIRDAGFTVVLDPNGGAGCWYPEVLREFGVTVIEQGCQPGLFERAIEPNAKSLAPLQSIVAEKGALVAAGFDCDADRVELVTEAEVISGNHVLGLVVDEVLSALEPGQTVVVNDATSQLVEQVAMRHQASVVEAMVGEINVVDAMLRHDAAVGGEGSSSGGIIPPSRCRDGLHSLLFVLAYCARSGSSLSDALGELPCFVSVRENLRIPVERVDDARKRFIEHFERDGADVRVDQSVKAVFPDDRWAWIRASRTEPGVVRVLVDARTKAQAQSLLSQAVAVVTAE